MISEQFIRSLHDPDSRQASRLERITNSRRLKFLLALGSTYLSDKEGFSAAGQSPEARRLTPAVDAEALVLGQPLSAAGLPVSPEGIVSPVVITRAMLGITKIEPLIFDCGSFRSPQIAHRQIGNEPAQCLSTGKALSICAVENLFKKGILAGKEYSTSSDCLILAECVPGGTTTAMAVLTALGFPVCGLVSGSMPICDHEKRSLLIEAGMKNVFLPKCDGTKLAFAAMAAFGDPIQPFITGIVVGASPKCQIVLGGGSQMLAIFALLKALPEKIDFSSISVITTKWVAFDNSAGSARLAELVQAPLFAACPDFLQSRHSGLRAYERGHVKEGVGAGAALALAFLQGATPKEIISAVDTCYDEMVFAGRDH